MEQNDDLNPLLFRIFSVSELSAIAYNLYLRNPKGLDKHWKEIVKQIICRAFQKNNIDRSSSVFAIALALSHDIKSEDQEIYTKNILASSDSTMLRANELLAKKIISKCINNPNITPIMAVNEIFDHKQGLFSKFKQIYKRYISLQMILEMYKKAIELEFFTRYEAEQIEASQKADLLLEEMMLEAVNSNKQLKTFQSLLREADNKKVNNIMFE